MDAEPGRVMFMPPTEGDGLELTFQSGDTTWLLGRGNSDLPRRPRALALTLLRLALEELEEQEQESN